MDMTPQELDMLITCPKEIVKKPRKSFQDSNGNRRNDFTAKSAEGEFFRIFMRQNLRMLEDFSIGLIWECKEYPDEDIIICRFNGPHGGNQKIETHFVTHIHKLNLELATNDIFRTNDVSETKCYSTFHEAIYSFCEHCHIKGAIKYFPEAYSQSLF